jgi:hypothetical protein
VLLASGKPCSTAELAQLQVSALCWANRLGQVDAPVPQAGSAQRAAG